MLRSSKIIIKPLLFNQPFNKFKSQSRHILSINNPYENNIWTAVCIDRAPLSSVNPLYASNYWYNVTTKRYEISFNPTRVAYQFRCTNPSSYIYEFIIARHDCPKENNLITFIVYSNPLVDQHVIKEFKQSIYLNECVVIDNQNFNERIGVGKTISQNVPEAQNQINELIAIFNKLHLPLPCLIQKNIIDFINPTTKDNDLAKKFPQQKRVIVEYPRTTGKPINTFCESDDVLPTILPDIFTYILDDNYIKLKSLLQEHPQLANVRDPIGCYAHDVACHISSNQIFKLFFIARERLGYINEHESIIQDHYARYFNNQYSVVSILRDSECQRSKHKEGYLYKLSQIKIHKYKDKDNFSTPTNNKPSFSQTIQKTIPDLSGEKNLMLILKHQIDKDFSNMLATAIKRNELAIVKPILYYMKQLPEKDNATFLEFILKEYKTISLEMYNFFLLYYKKTYAVPLPTGVLNKDVSQEIQTMTKEYNCQIQILANKKLSTPILQYPSKYQSKALIETFVSSDNRFNILSIQKPIRLLTASEKQEMYELFFYNFSIINDNSTRNQQKYFATATSGLSNKDSFELVNLFYDQKTNKLVSFLTTRIISSYHQSVGDFVLFHSKFAGNNPAYSCLNLTNLGVRNFLAEGMMQTNKPVYMFIKSIPPGYALSVFPFHVDFSPKKTIPAMLLEHIVSLAEDALTGEVIPCKLKVNAERKPTFANLSLTFYKDLIEDDEKNAMPVVISCNEECIKQYFVLLKNNGITLDNFNNYIQQYNQIKQDNQPTVDLQYTL